MPEQPSGDRPLPTVVSELWTLVKTYARQETVGPLKGIGRSFAYGVGGSIVLSLGLVLLSLALLRALQSETGTTFTGSWSWAPYLLTLAGVGVVITLALAAARRRGGPTATRGAAR